EPRQPRPAIEKPAPTLAPEPVPEVVSDDRSGRRNHDQAGDREMSLRRVDPGRNQGGLAWKPEAGGLQTDDPEHEEESVVLHEVGHARPSVRKLAPCESGFRGSSSQASVGWPSSPKRSRVWPREALRWSWKAARASRRRFPITRMPRPARSSPATS